MQDLAFFNQLLAFDSKNMKATGRHKLNGPLGCASTLCVIFPKWIKVAGRWCLQRAAIKTWAYREEKANGACFDHYSTATPCLWVPHPLSIVLMLTDKSFNQIVTIKLWYDRNSTNTLILYSMVIRRLTNSKIYLQRS